MNTMAILLSDTYKQIHNKIYPKGLTKLVSYWTPRRSMLKNQNKMVFFGLQAFIEEYLIDYFNKNFFELTAAAWISTALAVIVGIEVTHSAWCLWAFLLPLLMS